MRVGESFAPQHESSRPQELIELARPVSHWFIQPIDFHQITANVISIIYPWYVEYFLGSDNDMEWHQKEFLTWILGWCWCNAGQCISIERWTRSPHNPRSHHWCRLFPTFSAFCFPGLYPETINPTILGLLQGMHLNGIAAPILRFEITLAFSNCQGLLSIIQHSWVMQLMQVDKASNFVILLAAPRSTTFSRPGSW